MVLRWRQQGDWSRKKRRRTGEGIVAAEGLDAKRGRRKWNEKGVSQFYFLKRWHSKIRPPSEVLLFRILPLHSAHSTEQMSPTNFPLCFISPVVGSQKNLAIPLSAVTSAKPITTRLLSTSSSQLTFPTMTSPRSRITNVHTARVTKTAALTATSSSPSKFVYKFWACYFNPW